MNTEPLTDTEYALLVMADEAKARGEELPPLLWNRSYPWKWWETLVMQGKAATILSERSDG